MSTICFHEKFSRTFSFLYLALSGRPLQCIQRSVRTQVKIWRWIALWNMMEMKYLVVSIFGYKYLYHATIVQKYIFNVHIRFTFMIIKMCYILSPLSWFIKLFAHHLLDTQSIDLRNSFAWKEIRRWSIALWFNKIEQEMSTFCFRSLYLRFKAYHHNFKVIIHI